MFSFEVSTAGASYLKVTQVVLGWLFSTVNKVKGVLDSFNVEYLPASDGMNASVRFAAAISNGAEFCVTEAEFEDELRHQLVASEPECSLVAFEFIETTHSVHLESMLNPAESTLNPASYAAVDDELLEIADF